MIYACKKMSMKILDENLTKKITYSPSCRDTIKKYRKQLLYEIWIYSASLIISLCVSAFIVVQYSNMKEFILQVFAVFFILFWISVYKLSNLIPDIRSNKLDIRKDVFLSLKQEQNSYIVEFKEEGSLKLFVPGLFKLKGQEEVFIIRTSVTKKTLEVISVNAIK